MKLQRVQLEPTEEIPRTPGDKTTCIICLEPFDHPSGGFTADEQEVYDQKANDEERVEYLEELRRKNIRRFEIEILIPGGGQQYHRMCLEQHIHKNAVRDANGRWAATDPLTRDPIDPQIVQDLKTSYQQQIVEQTDDDGVESLFENGRLLRRYFPSNQTVEIYEGEAGQEVLVRRQQPFGIITYYQGGPRGQERIVKTSDFNGRVDHYQGEHGREYVVRSVFPNGTELFFERDENGVRRLVRKIDIDGFVTHYEGAFFSEYMVRRELPNGMTIFYEGPKNRERMVKKTTREELVFFYEGAKGEEHLVSIYNPRKKWTTYYEGLRDNERKVSRHLENGTILRYEGPHKAEVLRSKTFPDGTIWEYDGPRDAIVLVKKIFPHGTVVFYEGPCGEERAVPSCRRRRDEDPRDEDPQDSATQRQRTGASLGTKV